MKKKEVEIKRVVLETLLELPSSRFDRDSIKQYLSGIKLLQSLKEEK